jgi:hypothetical protein
MVAMKDRLDVYSDFLLASFSLATATGLSELLDGDMSHDAVTRLLRENEFAARELWKLAKPLVRKYEAASGVLIFDDTIIEKAHTDETELICWHWDHSKQRNVKGISLLSAFYHSDPLCVPVGYELITKPHVYTDPNTGKHKRRAQHSKNELLRQMLSQCLKNQLKFRYVLADAWFASTENMEFIDQKKRFFIFEMKRNRHAALSQEDKLAGRWTPIESLALGENSAQTVWLKGVKFPLRLIRQVFTNEDGSRGERYLVTNDLELDFDATTTIYQKRWKVEEYHKSLKQNTAIDKSPTKTLRSQSNHLFAALFAYIKLERLKLASSLNHFAMKTKLYLAATKAAFKELRALQYPLEYPNIRA